MPFGIKFIFFSRPVSLSIGYFSLLILISLTLLLFVQMVLSLQFIRLQIFKSCSYILGILIVSAILIEIKLSYCNVCYDKEFAHKIQKLSIDFIMPNHALSCGSLVVIKHQNIVSYGLLTRWPSG